MIIGKQMVLQKIIGVGYRASNQGQKLDLALDILTILF
jgi:hypothetical protein